MIEPAESTRAKAAPRVVELAHSAWMATIGTRPEGARWRRRSRVKLGPRSAEFRRAKLALRRVEFRRRRVEFAWMIEMPIRTCERHAASVEVCTTCLEIAARKERPAVREVGRMVVVNLVAPPVAVPFAPPPGESRDRSGVEADAKIEVRADIEDARYRDPIRIGD